MKLYLACVWRYVLGFADFHFHFDLLIMRYCHLIDILRTLQNYCSDLKQGFQTWGERGRWGEGTHHPPLIVSLVIVSQTTEPILGGNLIPPVGLGPELFSTPRPPSVHIILPVVILNILNILLDILTGDSLSDQNHGIPNLLTSKYEEHC